MKEFNLELAKQGHPVCTRDGRPVRIVCWDRKYKTPNVYRILALIDSEGDETIASYTDEGRFNIEGETASDLMMVSEKHEGWVNVYKSNDVHEYLDSFALYQMQQGIFETKDEALRAVKKSIKYTTYIATVRIEWEE